VKQDFFRPIIKGSVISRKAQSLSYVRGSLAISLTIRERCEGDFSTVMGGALRRGVGTICRIGPQFFRFQANKKCFKRSNVLEHSLENREIVECISEFATLLRVCDRQSP